jgi:hypothetical protein
MALLRMAFRKDGDVGTSARLPPDEGYDLRD